MKAIINGRIILKDRLLDGRALVFDEKIKGFFDAVKIPKNYEIIDAGGAYVSPGLIDIHIHGCFGEDASDGSEGGLIKMSEGLARYGVTSWVPATMTVPLPQLKRAFNAIRAAREKDPANGAAILGANMEGPYLNKKRKGAHLEEHLRLPDADFIKENADVIKIVTIAPEIDEDFKTIRAAREAGVTVSIGHSDANYDTASAGIANGISHATHLFNAMSPLNHRDPGVAGAALNFGITVELIADTFHIHKDLFNLIYKLKKDKLILISDNVRAAGLPDGEYELAGQKIILKGIECRLPDGTISGSVLTMMAAVKNIVEYSDAPLHEAVASASLYPARVVGADAAKGSVEIGKDADLVMFDGGYNVLKTIKRGRVIYEA